MKGLTQPQARVFGFISGYIKNNGHSPTFREIQTHFSFASLGSVYAYIKALKKKGLLADQKNATISLKAEIARLESTEIQLPFIGHLAAGFPIEIFHQAQTVAIPPSIVAHPEDTYVLKAKGDTLIDEHIMDGDLLLIEAKSSANEGELVVATLNYRNTIVKRFFPEGSYIRLEGSDGRHEPIILNPDELQIQGVVIGLIRNYI